MMIRLEVTPHLAAVLADTLETVRGGTKQDRKDLKALAVRLRREVLTDVVLALAEANGDFPRWEGEL